MLTFLVCCSLLQSCEARKQVVATGGRAALRKCLERSTDFSLCLSRVVKSSLTSKKKMKMKKKRRAAATEETGEGALSDLSRRIPDSSFFCLGNCDDSTCWDRCQRRFKLSVTTDWTTRNCNKLLTCCLWLLHGQLYTTTRHFVFSPSRPNGLRPSRQSSQEHFLHREKSIQSILVKNTHQRMMHANKPYMLLFLVMVVTLLLCVSTLQARKPAIASCRTAMRKCLKIHNDFDVCSVDFEACVALENARYEQRAAANKESSLSDRIQQSHTLTYCLSSCDDRACIDRCLYHLRQPDEPRQVVLPPSWSVKRRGVFDLWTESLIEDPWSSSMRTLGNSCWSIRIG